MVEIRLLHDYDESRAVLTEPDLESNIQFFYRDAMGHRRYIAALSQGKVVGLVAFIDQSSMRADALGLCFLSTHPEFRNHGIAKQLAAALFAYAKQNGKHIACSSYEELGRLYLKHVLARTQAAFPAVQLFERD